MIFCPGCGDGMIVQALAHAVDELGVGDELLKAKNWRA